MGEVHYFPLSRRVRRRNNRADTKPLDPSRGLLLLPVLGLTAVFWIGAIFLGRAVYRAIVG